MGIVACALVTSGLIRIIFEVLIMMLNITPLLVMWATIQPRVSLVLPLIRFTAASSIEKNHRINSIHRAIRFHPLLHLKLGPLEI
ncbi:hypothetical protein VTN31DRAFT_2382 [Thermomyces dupontii]|uniref:uncharacterized protein n=1 Tax=Talaromyces thermophilus TaxID=28565 RepID=UPI0037425521